MKTFKIGIHHHPGSFSDKWIEYCEKHQIPYKIVNAYATDIISQLSDCQAFMWHHAQYLPQDLLMAKQLLFALEHAGIEVFPNWITGWFFDDKLGQKYLLEATQLPLIPTYLFLSKKDALAWAENFEFPAVFKLRGGAGSSGVYFVKNKKAAKRFINKAFGKGFRLVNPWLIIRDSIVKFRHKENSFIDVLKSLAHLIIPFRIEQIKHREKGYALFQKYIPSSYDIRVQIVGKKGYAMARMARKNDFRISGSGTCMFDGRNLDPKVIELSCQIVNKLKIDSIGIDFLKHGDDFLIAEITHIFGIAAGETDYGWFDENLTWHNGVATPEYWMIELLIERLKRKFSQYDS